MTKKIAVFTGTRAEYGLLYWLIKRLHEAQDIELQLLVGGTHLCPEYGYTVNQIEKDGFPISDRIEMLLASDSPVAISKSMALATMGAAEAFARNQPDLLVVLGDRYEALAVVQATIAPCIPVAHIHGGELTEGLIDEVIRHSITKMSHLHFTATDTYRNRVIQLGEQPQRVFNVGAPGIDNIQQLTLCSPETLNERFAFDFTQPYCLVTYHPVTLTPDGAVDAMRNMLKALSKLDMGLVITYPNADTHGSQLLQVLQAFQKQQGDRVLLTQSMGQVNYLSAMEHAVAVVGNSSSGLIETPSFGVPTVNIGDRQKGRIAGSTVVSCGESESDISKALAQAMDEGFRKACQQATNPYGLGNSSEKIFAVLQQQDLSRLIAKPFYDLAGELGTETDNGRDTEESA